MYCLPVFVFQSVIPHLFLCVSGCNDSPLTTGSMRRWKPDTDSDVYMRVKADAPSALAGKLTGLERLYPRVSAQCTCSKAATRLYLPFHQSLADKPGSQTHTHTYAETSKAISSIQAVFYPLSAPVSRLNLCRSINGLTNSR